MYNDITGVILSGGKSSRMGTNKSFLKINDTTIIGRIVELMKSIFAEVIVITNTPEEYEFLNVPLYEDIYKWKGPLAGIHSGLVHSKTEKNFVISCDVPLMTKDMIEYIVEFDTNHPVTIARADGFIQQLAGRYSKSVIPKAEKILQQKIEETGKDEQKKRCCSVLRLMDEVGSEIIDAEKLLFYKKNIFLNINKPRDYEMILSIYNTKGKI